jgi:hypothetical protein
VPKKQSMSERSEPTAAEEKERDRLILIGLYYWQAQYDFQKSLMTLGLAATAGFIALLGGFFGGTVPWPIGDFKSTLCIVVVFLGFFVSMAAALRAAMVARSLIGCVPAIRKASDIDNDLAPRTARRFRVYYLAAVASFLVALVILAFFMASTLIVFKACYTDPPNAPPVLNMQQCSEVYSTFRGWLE